MDSLGEDLVLLSIRHDSGTVATAQRIGYGLMGAELVRLAASGPPAGGHGGHHHWAGRGARTWSRPAAPPSCCPVRQRAAPRTSSGGCSRCKARTRAGPGSRSGPGRTA
ncbi:MAG: hypothetical protein ACR2FU_22905 [Streptosporangiaceae bacterium]